MTTPAYTTETPDPCDHCGEQLDKGYCPDCDATDYDLDGADLAYEGMGYDG